MALLVNTTYATFDDKARIIHTNLLALFRQLGAISFVAGACAAPRAGWEGALAVRQPHPDAPRRAAEVTQHTAAVQEVAKLAHARIIQKLAVFDSSFDAFARSHLGFCGFFVQFSLNAVAVDAQLLQEELPQREFDEHLAYVHSTCLLLFHLAEPETLYPVEFFGMAGIHFRSTVQHLPRTVWMVVVDQAGPSDPTETSTALTPGDGGLSPKFMAKASPLFRPPPPLD